MPRRWRSAAGGGHRRFSRRALRSLFRRSGGARRGSSAPSSIPNPRVLLIPGVGIVCAGKTRKDAAHPRPTSPRHTLRHQGHRWRRLAATSHSTTPTSSDVEVLDPRGRPNWARSPEKAAGAAGPRWSTGAAGAIGTGRRAWSSPRLARNVVLTDIDPGSAGGAPAAKVGAGLPAAAPASRSGWTVTDEGGPLPPRFDHACRAFWRRGHRVVSETPASPQRQRACRTRMPASSRESWTVNLGGYFPDAPRLPPPA